MPVRRSAVLAVVAAGAAGAVVGVTVVSSLRGDDEAGPAATAPATATAAPTRSATTSAPPEAPGLNAPDPTALAETDEFGAVVSMTPAGGGRYRIEVDRVDWFSGEEANREAAADGQESPVSNDYYVRNVNPRLRSYVLAPDAEVFGSIVMTGNVEPTPRTLQQWSDFLAGQDDQRQAITYYHLDVEDGVVVGVEEQYRP